MHGTVGGDHRRKRKGAGFGAPGRRWDETVVYEAKQQSALTRYFPAPAACRPTING